MEGAQAGQSGRDIGAAIERIVRVRSMNKAMGELKSRKDVPMPDGIREVGDAEAAEVTEDEAIQIHPLANAGPLTLHERRISFAVDGDGAVLRYPDGEPIDGALIEDAVKRSGRVLTNAQAAGEIVAARLFVGEVEAELEGLTLQSDPADDAVEER